MLRFTKSCHYTPLLWLYCSYSCYDHNYVRCNWRDIMFEFQLPVRKLWRQSIVDHTKDFYESLSLEHAMSFWMYSSVHVAWDRLSVPGYGAYVITYKLVSVISVTWLIVLKLITYLGPSLINWTLNYQIYLCCRCIESLVHASQCRNANCKLTVCEKMKRVVSHTKQCKVCITHCTYIHSSSAIEKLEYPCNGVCLPGPGTIHAVKT